jgi:hypothetical protein
VVVTWGRWFVCGRESHLDSLAGSPLLGLGQRGQHPPVGLGEGWLQQAPRPQPPGQHHVDLGGIQQQLPVDEVKIWLVIWSAIAC